MSLNEIMVQSNARKLKVAIQKFCRARVNAGICGENECDLCPCNETYYMVEQYTKEEEKEEDE